MSCRDDAKEEVKRKRNIWLSALLLSGSGARYKNIELMHFIDYLCRLDVLILSVLMRPEAGHTEFFSRSRR